jgi:hypothetical protein
MFEPLFVAIKASSAVTNLIGTSPVRFYAFGEAPATVAKPYAVYRTVYGSPENVLDGIPATDSFGFQIDAYGLTGASAGALSAALRAAIETYAYVTAYNGDGRDPDTKNYFDSFTVDWINPR